jgi:excisionase family DNA binding protein
VSAALLSPEDVARQCSLSRRAVYRAIERGELRASRLCSRLRVRPEDVDAWIAANHVEPAERVGVPPPLAPAHNGLRRLLATSEREGER